MKSNDPVISHAIVHLNESLQWIIPSSLAVVTVILLILGLASEIGTIKKNQDAAVMEIKDLKKRTANLEELNGVVSDTTKDTPQQPGSATVVLTYSNESNLITNLKSKYGTLELSPNQSVWTYSFDSEKILTKTADFVMIGNTDSSMSYVVYYQSNQSSGGDYKIFGLAPFSDTEKRLVLTNDSKPANTYFKEKPKTSVQIQLQQSSSNITNVIVFVDGKVVLFNDFKENSKLVLKDSLNSIQTSNDAVPAKIKLAAQTELRSIAF